MSKRLFLEELDEDNDELNSSDESGLDLSDIFNDFDNNVFEDEDEDIDITSFTDFSEDIDVQDLINDALGIQELSKSQRVRREKRRSAWRRKNPGLARKLARAFKKNKSKIQRKLAQFMKSAKGRLSIKRRGKHVQGAV